MTGAVARWLGVHAPDRPVQRWHTSPTVDLTAYAFSWAWVLIPMAFLGDSYSTDYAWIYLLVLTATDVHRHYNYPYIYLDRQVFFRHPLRFLVFPAAMAALWLATPWAVRARYLFSITELTTWLGGVFAMMTLLRRDGAGKRIRPRDGLFAVAWTLTGWAVGKAATASVAGGSPEFTMREIFIAVAVFAGLWNIYHVYNQKYGILRLYSAKSGSEERVPPIVDRLLIWGWLPLYLMYLSPRYGDYVTRLLFGARELLRPVFGVLDAISVYLLWPCAIFVAGTVVAFLWYEWRCHRLQNAPRLWMALGTTILASSFLWIHPLKAYLAYAFSHAIEYMVFVWAFQRRRYDHPLEHRPLLGRVLKHPIVAYGVFTIGLAATFLYMKYYGRSIFSDERPPTFLGFTTYRWVAYWTVYQSMVHFYFDGFLWKMRLPTVRANI